jgi:hypothetical protein
MRLYNLHERLYTLIDSLDNTVKIISKGDTTVPSIKEKLKQLDLFKREIVELNRKSIFFDEFNRADSDIFNIMMQLLDQHILGGVKVRDTFLIVSAGNIFTSGNSGQGVQDMKSNQALMSRFKPGYLVCNPFEWLKFATKNGVNRDILDFISFKPYKNLGIQNQAEETEEELEGANEEERGYTFPTPRSVEMFNQEYEYINDKYNEAIYRM